jgi:DeoR family fructose operon transcriptional repressor
MLAEQRLERILKIVNERGFVEVEELSSVLGVSAMTVRRDLQKLSLSGDLIRQHGGAMAVTQLKGEKDYAVKKTVNQENKRRIAQKAVDLLEESEVIYLDGGTTTFEIAALIGKKKGITVLTNDFLIAAELMDKEPDIIFIGGVVQKRTSSTAGISAVHFLEQYRVTKSFLGLVSVNHEYDVMTPTADKAYLKRMAMEVAGQAYFVADSSKFYGQSLNRICNLSETSGIITDKKFTEREQEKLNSLGINVISA